MASELEKEAEKIDPPKQGPLDQGDETEKKHVEAEKLTPIVPEG